jgi:hypothetical protein
VTTSHDVDAPAGNQSRLAADGANALAGRNDCHAAPPTPTANAQAGAETPVAVPRDKPWTPKVWDGMGLWAWLRLLVRGRFRVAPRRWGMALVVTIMSLINSTLGAVQWLVWGVRLRRMELQPPLFVLGHWRSGTTLLHELLVLDPRHSYCSTYECFSPKHFLLTERIVQRWFSWLLPRQRLQDDMDMSWDKPQEDEFALGNLGLPSPYLTMAFPNRGPVDHEYLDFEGVPPRQVRRWQQKFRRFLCTVVLRRPGRLVLKSPTHTGRIAALLEMFPDARFVYIVRNPYAVYSSTVKLWKVMYTSQGFHTPRFVGLHEYVLETFTRLHRAVERTRHLVPPGHFCLVRYEDLTADPLGEMQRVYRELDLGDFEPVRPALEQYVAQRADYRPSRHQLDPATRAAVCTAWHEFFQQYGYAEGTDAPVPPDSNPPG